MYSAQATRDGKTEQRSLDYATRRTRLAELAAASGRCLLHDIHFVRRSCVTSAKMLRVAELSGLLIPKSLAMPKGFQKVANNKMDPSHPWLKVS